MFASSRFNPMIGCACRVLRRRQAQTIGAGARGRQVHRRLAASADDASRRQAQTIGAVGARGRQQQVHRRLATSAADDAASKSKDELSPLYKFMWRERRPLGLNMTGISYHVSMVLSALALVNTDMLALRATTLASSFFLGTFQYFRYGELLSKACIGFESCQSHT